MIAILILTGKVTELKKKQHNPYLVLRGHDNFM